MKTQKTSKKIFFTILFSTLCSSCGLIEKYRTNGQPTDSKAPEAVSIEKSESSGEPSTDDLFAKAMNDTKEETLKATSEASHTDAPANITTEAPEAQFEAKPATEVALEPTTAPVAEEVKPAKVAKVAEVKPVKVEEAIPEIKSDPLPEVAPTHESTPGKIVTYKVLKGETLMQVAFKLYGDIGKWKELKQMNHAKLSANTALKTNMELKYAEPDQPFVWSPEGTPYLIKNGETLGTISNTVYKTPRKWKKLWENNKPLIKNPNVIYSGFTLYYKGTTMANFVQPKALQNKVARKTATTVNEPKPIATPNSIEEVKIDQAISSLEANDPNQVDLTKDMQSSTMRDVNSEFLSDIKGESLDGDEALTH